MIEYNLWSLIVHLKHSAKRISIVIVYNHFFQLIQLNTTYCQYEKFIIFSLFIFRKKK